MSLLPRLRYILEVCCPAAPTVHDILDILTRISQHSTQAANEVFKCPRLMETIFANFLPLSWKTSDMQSGVAHGQPVSAAMQLIRTVCCAGRHMAATLVSKSSQVCLLQFILYSYSVCIISFFSPCMWGIKREFSCLHTALSCAVTVEYILIGRSRV